MLHTFHLFCVRQSNRITQKDQIHDQTVKLHWKENWVQLGDQWVSAQQSRDNQLTTDGIKNQKTSQTYTKVLHDITKLAYRSKP